MAQETRQSSVEDTFLEVEGSSLIREEYVPSIVTVEKFTDENIFPLSEQLARKGLCEGFVLIWGQWTSRPHITLQGLGWMFKFFLWCLR